ncbi:AAA family ATPase [Bifidobacterium criceti]|uniref:ATPase AAA n=1 Tax=Bifidobacterium criceti TaxID=1960969 RepID=A0A2A2EJ07_9BIFI|nr:MoxR family ATPase [Bifidobacterium criceti]PAU68930.1 ATPase AAA [Bifidobacterium criceti]
MTNNNDDAKQEIAEETVLAGAHESAVEQSAAATADETVLASPSAKDAASPTPSVPHVVMPDLPTREMFEHTHTTGTADDADINIEVDEGTILATAAAPVTAPPVVTPPVAASPVSSPVTASPSTAASSPLPTRDGSVMTSTVHTLPPIGAVAGTGQATNEEIATFKKHFSAIVDNVSQVVVGKESPIRQCVTALVAGGHILLEDNPGTGKTQLARAIANSVRVSFKRIQFTPDLLPSDVVGVTFYDQKTGEFSFREGPIFASIVLADEINRASPKTQSAMLEVMEEQKVTVDGHTHPVPQPFIVIATQNPIEQLGTYKLPEAQMDRFLIKTTIGYPSTEYSLDILRQVNITDRAGEIGAVASGDDILAMRAIANKVRVDDSILEYIMRIIESTRHDESIAVGSSMRGALALTRCARVWAAADGRGYVIPDDVKALAVPVLAHRIMLTSDAVFLSSTPEDVLTRILGEIPAPQLGAN